ncbi:MAG: ABC transporter permease, partial [Candidatus Marsarchaeota archaeon]|nr:ABC transporter permease [Candidatus Marsarchaeota archaeon]
MRLARYALRRLLFIVPVVLGAIFIAFFLTRIVPGNPIDRVAGPYVSNERRAEMKHEAGLDLPFYQQFANYLGNLAQGDMGISYTTAQPVIKDLTERLPATVELVTYGIGLAILVGIPLGIISAVKRGSLIDHLSRVISVAGVSVPLFWLALVLLFFFFFSLRLLPGPLGRLPTGMAAPQTITGFFTIDSLLTGNWEAFREAVRALVLPVIVLGLVAMAPIARMTRSSMVDALESDYIRAARAMGLPGRVIIWRYALKNALLPVITIIAAVYGYAIGGEVLLEYIFAWPGIGLYSFNAILASDFPAIQGFIILVTSSYIL